MPLIEAAVVDRRRMPARCERSTRISDRLRRAVRYVLDMQSPNGAWCDFHLGVGLSEAWTTAYIGACLVGAERWIDAAEYHYLRAALDRAAAFLHGARRSDGTWSYNRHVPSDSDSTSWAAMFLEALGQSPGRETYDALRSFAQPDGGFATYRPGETPATSSAWATSHPDVTPVVLRALGLGWTKREATLDYIRDARRFDGLWNAYWYRTPLYATLHNLLALRLAGRPASPPAPAVLAAGLATRDPFELALALEIAVCFGGEAAAGLVRDATAAVLALQSPDGWWSADAFLRVTDERLDQPWVLPGDRGGALYADDYYLFTTATVTHALTRLLTLGRTLWEDVDVALL